MEETTAGITALARRLVPARRWRERFRTAPGQAYERYLDTVTSAVFAAWQESPQELGCILDALDRWLAYRARTPLGDEAQAYWDSARELSLGLVGAFRRWLTHPPAGEEVATVSEQDLQARFCAACEAAAGFEASGDPALLQAATRIFEQTAVLIIAGAPVPRAVFGALPGDATARVRTWITGLLTVVTAPLPPPTGR